MNVRLRTLRALLCAGLILVPHTLFAQLKITATTSATATPAPYSSVDEVDKSKIPPPPFLRLASDDRDLGFSQTFLTKRIPKLVRTATSTTTTSSTKDTSTSGGATSSQQAQTTMAPLDEGGSQEVSVQILARQITCNGVQSAQIPAKLSYKIGNNAPVPLFDGNNVEEGMATNFTLPSGDAQSLKFIATFLKTGPCLQKVTESDHPIRALNILGGMNLIDLIAEKEINLVWAGQNSLLSYLVPTYVDPETGIATMDSQTSVIAFESMSSGLAFDMQDLLIKVTTPGPQYVDQWVREAIGDPQATYEMVGAPMHSFLPNYNPFYVSAVELPVSQAGYLSQVRLIGYDSGSTPHPDLWSFTVMLWSDPSIPLNNPSMRRTGDLANITFQAPPRATFGLGPNQRITYEYLLDLSSLQAWLEPGHTYMLGVTMNSYPGTDGVFIVSTSQILYEGDKVFTPTGVFPVSGSSNTLAMSVSQSVPAVPQQGEKSNQMMQQLSLPSDAAKLSGD